MAKIYKDEILNYEKECLIEEYRSIQSAEKTGAEISMKIKNWCITVWLLAIGLTIQTEIENYSAMYSIFVSIFAFWFLNIFYSHYGKIRKQRLEKICFTLNNLFFYSTEDIMEIKSPINYAQEFSKWEKLKYF